VPVRVVHLFQDEASMSAHPPPGSRPDGAGEIPFGQRLFDNVFFWLVAGLLVMGVVYTGWGLWEILTMPPATLP
jgi:hypothetical protein